MALAAGMDQDRASEIEKERIEEVSVGPFFLYDGS